MYPSSFSLTEIVTVLRRRWTTVLFFVLASIAVASVTLYVVPKQYQAKAVLVPANSELADKGRFFNPNLQRLYSYFGSGDDIDRIVGIGETEQLMLELVQQFSLVKYYELSGDSLPVLEQKAVKKLRREIRLIKNENAQIEITAWSKNKQLSADIVNSLIAQVEKTEKEIWLTNYRQAKTKLDTGSITLEKQYQTLIDSIAKKRGSNTILSARAQQLLAEIQNYRKMADEFSLAMQTVPPALYVLQHASPSIYFVKPDIALVLILTGIASICFVSIFVLIADRKQNS